MATVLVIDDEKIVRDVITQRLHQEGHQVLSYADAAPALEAVDFADIDLILMDLMMPTPGERAITTLRHRGDATPILVLTGKSGAGEHLLSMGANRVLAKPFRLMGLLTNMEQLLPAN